VSVLRCVASRQSWSAAPQKIEFLLDRNYLQQKMSKITINNESSMVVDPIGIELHTECLYDEVYVPVTYKFTSDNLPAKKRTTWQCDKFTKVYIQLTTDKWKIKYEFQGWLSMSDIKGVNINITDGKTYPIVKFNGINANRRYVDENKKCQKPSWPKIFCCCSATTDYDEVN
jgi:hypothetical protein